MTPFKREIKETDGTCFKNIIMFMNYYVYDNMSI